MTMKRIVDQGMWCRECRLFEHISDIDDNGNCLACGHVHTLHDKAAVVVET